MQKKSLLIALTLCSQAFANPEGGRAQSGKVIIDSSGNKVTITTGDKALIHWDDFSIRSGEVTQFIQPDASSVVVNKVTGNNPSQISGLLQANGRVALINPRGVVITKEGIVKTAEFLASTSDVVDTSWSIQTQGVDLSHIDPKAIINHDGLIFAEKNGAQIVLFAPTTEVTGVVQAPAGHVDILGDVVAIKNQAFIDVSSTSSAGTVKIGGDCGKTASAVYAAKNTFVGPDAIVRADGIDVGSGGDILIWGSDAARGYGALSAKGGDISGKGGLIELSGHWVDLEGIRVSTLASDPMLTGHFIIDPYNLIISNANNNVTLTTPFSPTGTGATLEVNTIIEALGGSNVTITTIGTGGSEAGDITVASNLLSTFETNSLFITSANDIIVNNNINILHGGNLKLVANNSITLGENSSVGAGVGYNLVFAVDQASTSVGTGRFTMASTAKVGNGAMNNAGPVYFYLGNLANATFGPTIAGAAFVPGQYTSQGTFPGIAGTLPAITSPYAIYYKGIGATASVTDATQNTVNQATANLYEQIDQSGTWTFTSGTVTFVTETTDKTAAENRATTIANLNNAINQAKADETSKKADFKAKADAAKKAEEDRLSATQQDLAQKEQAALQAKIDEEQALQAAAKAEADRKNLEQQLAQYQNQASVVTQAVTKVDASTITYLTFFDLTPEQIASYNDTEWNTIKSKFSGDPFDRYCAICPNPNTDIANRLNQLRQASRDNNEANQIAAYNGLRAQFAVAVSSTYANSNHDDTDYNNDERLHKDNDGNVINATNLNNARTWAKEAVSALKSQRDEGLLLPSPRSLFVLLMGFVKKIRTYFRSRLRKMKEIFKKNILHFQ